MEVAPQLSLRHPSRTSCLSGDARLRTAVRKRILPSSTRVVLLLLKERTGS